MIKCLRLFYKTVYTTRRSFMITHRQSRSTYRKYPIHSKYFTYLYIVLKSKEQTLKKYMFHIICWDQTMNYLGQSSFKA